MKVGFSLDISRTDAVPGKHKFFIRLAKEMKRRGIKISNNKPDVYIRLAGTDICQEAKLNILRLDNVILDIKLDKKNRNKKALRGIKESDAIIYQSNFSKSLYNRFLGVQDDREYRIIYNGANPEEFLSRSPKNYFLANCKWRPCKRLKEIVKSFIKSLKMGLDADLVITGKPKLKDRIIHPRVKYLLWQDKDNLRSLLAGAIGSLHFTWLDCCPNSTIESMVAGVPIVYTRSGGLPELIRDSGIGIDDKEWDFKPFDEDCLPKVNRKMAAKAMLELKNNNFTCKREDLHIENICDQYISFLKELLKR